MKGLPSLSLLLPQIRINNSKAVPATLLSLSSAPQHSRGLMEQARDDCSKESSESKYYSDRIMPHLLNLYAARATARDFDIYAPNATFEDPLMRAHGVKQIKSAFYSMKVFSESEIVDYRIDEKVTSPGKHEILIDNKQHYKIFGRNIEMISLIVLNVEEGKVVRHEDRWNKKPILNKDTVHFPLIGRIFELSRRGAMLATHAMMGFGKDPSQ